MVPALCDSALTHIGICPQKFTYKLAIAGAALLLLGASGCGEDDEEPARTTSTSPPDVIPTWTSAMRRLLPSMYST